MLSTVLTPTMLCTWQQINLYNISQLMSKIRVAFEPFHMSIFENIILEIDVVNNIMKISVEVCPVFVM